MYLLLIYFCSITWVISIFLGNKLGNKGSISFLVTGHFVTLLISLYIFYEVCILHFTCYIDVGEWIVIGNIVINWSFIYDPLSSVMLVVILSISLFANIYSVDYMNMEPHKIRFFCYLSIFTFTMVLLVTANTLLQLFLGWELVGITSYLLINHWYTRIQANKASLLAIYANKFGDICLLFVSILIYHLYNNLDSYNIYICNTYTDDTYYKNMYYMLSNWDNINVYFINTTMSCIVGKDTFFILSDFINIISIASYGSIICCLVLLASICKSAQSGFHFWLAEAMEGPTPVSSLLHAATMVTAGVFLLTRCNIFFYSSHSVSIHVLFIGSLTSLFASLIGYFQNDFKKVVAYSTCSQLGYMFCATGVNSYDFAMFHLFNHAFFKALLFLSSGYLIHIFSNEQNVRNLGGFIKIVPLPYICFFIGSFSLIGLPFLSGFFSKDLIVEKIGTVHYIFYWNNLYYNIIYISQFCLFISLVLTIKYSIKVIFFVFINTYNGTNNLIRNIHFATSFVTIPLFILCILSIISGYIFSDLMIGIGSFFWGDLLEMSFYSDKILDINNKYYNYMLGDLPFEFNKFLYYSIYSLVVYYILLSGITYKYIEKVYTLFSINAYDIIYSVFTNISNKFIFFNRLYVKNMISTIYNESYKYTYSLIDKQLIEYVGPFGVIRMMWNSNFMLSKITLGLIYHYSGILNLVLMILFILLSVNLL